MPVLSSKGQRLRGRPHDMSASGRPMFFHFPVSYRSESYSPFRLTMHLRRRNSITNRQIRNCVSSPH